MLSTLFPSLFKPPPPACPGAGSALVRARRDANDEKYTARPLDFFPNVLVSDELLAETRREADFLDGMFARYKREAECLGQKHPGRLRRSSQACRFHTSYRIVCSSPLLFSDDVFVPPGCTDHGLLAPNKRMQTLQIRLRDHEHPYELALIQQYAQRWHGYCYACLPRVSATMIKQLDGQFQTCKCERADAAKRYRQRWLCAACFESECAEFAGGFEEKKCQGRACELTLGDVGWERFQPVCGWCLKVVDAKAMEVAREALREGEGFEVLRKDSKR
ncbi:hypothetical protein Q7P37_001356 [Cladosporium fusiforme]